MLFASTFLLRVICGLFIPDVIAGLAELRVPPGACGPPPLHGTPPWGHGVQQTFKENKKPIVETLSQRILELCPMQCMCQESVLCLLHISGTFPKLQGQGADK